MQEIRIRSRPSSGRERERVDPRRVRSLTLVAVLCCAFATAVRAAAAEEVDPNLVEPLRSWELTGNLRTSAGFKENVLLSAVRSEDSAFARAEAEVFWWRPPTERFEALAFANAALTRFFDSAENPREWQAFAHAEARWFASPAFQATGVVEGYHLDQVFDLSASHAEQLTTQLAVTGALTSVALRWNLRPTTWLELKPTAQRDRYRDGSDDNTQQIGRLTLGRSWLEGRLELSLAGQLLRRNYDHRLRYTIGGRPVTGADLDFEQRDGEATLAIVWDKARRWSTTTAALFGTNEDNGSGYFDYRRRSLRHEIAWKNDAWRVRLTGRAARYDYDVQTQGIGMNPPHRIKEEFLAQARVERQLTARLTVYTDLLWERSRSNDPLASYRVKTALAGVDFAY